MGITIVLSVRPELTHSCFLPQELVDSIRCPFWMDCDRASAISCGQRYYPLAIKNSWLQRRLFLLIILQRHLVVALRALT